MSKVKKKYFFKIALFLSLLLNFLFISSCGIYKPVNTRDIPQNAEEKRRKNIEEGRGISLKGLVGNKSTNFEFSSSNPLWRASLEVLDFIPLSTVDYAGGLIISDWYSNNNQNESIKISIQFLTNEITSTSLKITVYQKKCNVNNQCNTQKIDSKINNELRETIIKKAALIEKQSKIK